MGQEFGRGPFRRDFTINAMALGESEVIDPFGGQKDLENKIIKAVGDQTKDSVKMP